MQTTTLIPAPIVNVQDPTMWLDEPVVFALHRSGERLTYYPQLTSNSSNSNTTFEVTVPSLDTVTDRAIYLQMPVTVDFAGTAPVGQNLLQTGCDAFRAWPLQSVMSTLEIQINGTSYTQDQNRMVPYLTRINGFNNFTNYAMSTTPHYMDQSQTYDQLVGSIRNPLGGFGDSTGGTNTPRGAYPMRVVTNTNTAAQITATIIEPIMISPLIWGDAMKKGLCGVDRFVVKITWSTNLARIWSHTNAGGSVFTTPPVVTFGQPQLNLRYISPQRIYRQPDTFLYGLDSYRIYNTPTNTVLAPGSNAQQFSLNNIQLCTVPDMMILFARKRDADLTYLDADVFATITNVNITYGVQNGILASATQADLYQIARRNNVAMSWEEWSGLPISNLLGSTNAVLAGAGSILPLRIGIDIPVEAEKSPGVSVNTNVTVYLTIQNPSPQPVNYDLYLLTLDKGTWSIQSKRAITETGIISQVAAVEAQTVAPTLMYSRESNGMYGSGFFDSLWSGIKKVGNFVANEAVPFVANTVVPAVSAVRSLVGRGFAEEHQDDDNMSVRSYRSDRSSGSTGTNRDGMSGGQIMSLSSLRRRLDRV